MTERAGRAGRAGPPALPRPVPVQGATSPRLTALGAALAAGHPGALQAFWDGVVAGGGAPLVEAIAGEPDHRAVTFLWRDRAWVGGASLDAAYAAEGPPEAGAGTRNVLLLINRLTDYGDLAGSLMRRLPGTDVWYRSYRLRADWRGTYQIAPDDPDAPAGGPAAGAAGGGVDRRELFGKALPDPLNPKTVPNPRGRLAREQAAERPASLAELPAAPEQRWWAPREGVAAGEVSEHRVGSVLLGNERRVWVYTPPGYSPEDGPYDVLVLLDGDVWGPRLPVRHTLDNLLAEGRLRPTVALLVDSIDGPTRQRELSCHPPFVDFLRTELLPWAGARWRIADGARQTTIAGQSLGALTAAYAGLTAPERFGRLLMQSASLWWKGGSEFDVEGAALTRRFARTPRLPLRCYLEVGLQEWVLLPLTRHLRDVLEAREYPLTYAEYNGGHDFACWRGGLGDGLVALQEGAGG
jgi:enterochelin esterase family protein